MPLIDPMQLAWLRRQWQLTVAILVFFAFMVIHLAIFRPMAVRYQAAVRKAAALGFPVDQMGATPMMPPRVLALLSDNTIAPAEAVKRGNSGALTAALLEDLTRLTSQHGMEVVSTEPGITAQLPEAVQVRAHLQIRCTYPQFVAFLDEMGRGGRLVSIERFTMQSSGGGGRHQLDLFVTRYYVKLERKRA